MCRETRVVARKEHACFECRRAIVPGTLYVRLTGIWDKPRTYKMCCRCVTLRRLAVSKYPPVNEEEGPAFGYLRDWIRENRALAGAECDRGQHD